MVYAQKLKFKGFDFTELAETWDLEYDDDNLLNVLSGHMLRALDGTTRDAKEKREAAAVARDVREYANALARVDPSGRSGLWRGLAKIESDFNLLQVAVHLLPLMWS